MPAGAARARFLAREGGAAPSGMPGRRAGGGGGAVQLSRERPLGGTHRPCAAHKIEHLIKIDKFELKVDKKKDAGALSADHLGLAPLNFFYIL